MFISCEVGKADVEVSLEFRAQLQQRDGVESERAEAELGLVRA
jgi:hypothetical protein